MTLTFHGDFNRSENRTENHHWARFFERQWSDPLGPPEDVVTYPARVGFAPWRWPFLWSGFPVITIAGGRIWCILRSTLEKVSSFLDWSTSIHVYSLQSCLRHLAETILYSLRTVCLATKKYGEQSTVPWWETLHLLAAVHLGDPIADPTAIPTSIGAGILPIYSHDQDIE